MTGHLLSLVRETLGGSAQAFREARERHTIKTQDVSRIARFELHATMSNMHSHYSPNTLSTSLFLSLS